MSCPSLPYEDSFLVLDAFPFQLPLARSYSSCNHHLAKHSSLVVLYLFLLPFLAPQLYYLQLTAAPSPASQHLYFRSWQFSQEGKIKTFCKSCVSACPPKVPSPWLCLSCQVALICSPFVLSFLAPAKGETWEPSDPPGLGALLGNLTDDAVDAGICRSTSSSLRL